MVITEDALVEKLMIAYLDARENERNRTAQLEFEINLESNLYELKLDILKGRYEPLPLTCFIIEDPVKREVFAPNFRDRIISHFIYNEVIQIFERIFIYDSYACRKGKGTLFGIKRAEHQILSCTNNRTKQAYGLTLDISGYFMNINKNKLLDIVKGIFNKYQYRQYDENRVWDDVIDFKLIIFLLERILLRNPLKDCRIVSSKKKWIGLPPNKSLFNSPEGVGLIIGDVLSQLLSNVYMNVFDQYVKRVLKCKYYGRYVDDAFILHEDREYLRSIIPQIEEFLSVNLDLKLNKKKVKIFDLQYNFRFLGACIRPYRRYVRSRTVRKFRKTIYTIEKNITPETCLEYINTINSYLGYLSHFKTYREKRHNLYNKEINKYFKFTRGYKKAVIK